ncbi:MAG: multiheme c-type cytochrome [Pseudomonadales bacterium]
MDDDIHLGVASCATSVCHGKLNAQENENVWLNEYRIWTSRDRHARAYRTLTTDESKRIAEKLGLGNAATAKICLDCHADNIAEDKRGPKFQITDGVGCEACHGGAARWIESHAEPDATHADNLAKGMYPTEDPLARASICLSCHMGTKDQFATHRIMGAGHPRLTFELEAFTANQPAHYEADADYETRKQKLSGFDLWTTGQLESAERQMELIRSELFQPGGMFPELAFYDCHACHHPQDDLRWTTAQAGPGVGPGTLRLQDQHLRVLAVLARVLDGSGADVERATRDLVVAGQTSIDETRRRAGELLDWIRRTQQSWADRDHSDDQVRRVRAALLDEAARGRMADFADAEQVFLAVESLTFHLGDADAHRDLLDALFTAVENDEGFDPGRFAQAARRARDGFP